VLQRFNTSYPRVKVQLVSSFSTGLKEQFGRGECDLILTTESTTNADSETIAELPLRWIGAHNGSAWRQRPLRLAFGRHCLFRPKVIAALDAADLPWDMVVETESDRTIEATVAADLAIHAMLEGTEPQHLMQIDHGGALPDLPVQVVNLYGGDNRPDEVTTALANLIRQTFDGFGKSHLKAVG
jgi:DNA-binding transcriptional LysR family regulator